MGKLLVGRAQEVFLREGQLHREDNLGWFSINP